MKIPLFACLLPLAVFSSNILILLPMPLYSHTKSFLSVFKELASRGHNVTMVSPFPQKEPLANWTDIIIDEHQYRPALNKYHPLVSYTLYGSRSICNLFRLMHAMAAVALKNDNIRHLIRSDNLKYDLIITEPYFAHEPLVAFGHKLNATVIGIQSLYPTAWFGYASGYPIYTPDIPHYMTSYTDQMSLFEKLDNFIINTLDLITALVYYLPRQERLTQEYMVYPGSENRPSLLHMLRNIGLILLDVNPTTSYTYSYPPHVIPVGGTTLEDCKQLPEDLQYYMDSSTNGVIYLSFGYNVNVSSLGEDKVAHIMSVFQKLKYNVLFKWEKNTLKNKPPNVLTRKLFPQTCILAHPKCILFITHGGMHGMNEALYHGVPILGIPFMGDQNYNIKFIERQGLGIRLVLKDLTEETFQHTIENLINNPSYKENALKRSKIAKDRPHSSRDTAIYWIEYALRHKDLSHLKSSALNQSLYQIFLFDAATVFILGAIATLAITYVLMRHLSKMFIKCKDILKKKINKKLD